SAAQIQLNKRVRDVLGRELAAQLLPEQPAEVDAAKPDRLRVINARMEALETARNLLRKAIEEKRGPASAAICERVAPEFNGLCDDLIAKSLELHAAFLAYMQFADKMNSANVSWARLGPLAVHAVPEAVATLLKSAKQVGRITDLPKGLR